VVPTSVAVALGVLAVAASVLAIVFGLEWSGLSSANDRASQAKGVATAFLIRFTNFTPSTVNTDFKSLQSFATGNFSKQAALNFGNAGLRQGLEQSQVVSKGTVRNSYVQALNGDKAQVYAVVDQYYTNAQLTHAGSPQIHDVLRLQISLADVSGTWKISDVMVLSGPSSAATPSSGG
jgi:hypothetical protein